MSNSGSDHQLEIYRSGRAGRWPRDADLDLLLGDLLGEELLWAVRPARSLWGSSLGSETGRVPAPKRVHEAYLRGRLRPETVLRKIQRTLQPATAAPFRVQAALDQGVLKLWTTENHRLALFGRGQQPRNVKTLVAPTRSVRAVAVDAVEAAKEAARRTGSAPEPLLRAIAQAYSVRAILDEAIQCAQPVAVMLASTEHPFCRVAVSVCRSRAIPSIYVPHAPTALNRNYADVPHDLAFLRGTADRDYYVSLGADPEAIEVVGDPMFVPPESGQRRGDSVVLLATGVDRPLEELIRTFELVRSSGVAEFGTVVVAPHPRGRGEVQRLAPRYGFVVADPAKRTSQVLAESNVLVMVTERSSGVALEALAAGVPVVSLSDHQNYLFEVELGLAAVDGPVELATAVAEIAELEPYERVNAEQVDRFVSASGEAALEAVNRLATRAPVTSRGVVDSWRQLSRHGACGATDAASPDGGQGA